MSAADLLVDAFGRIHHVVHDVVDGMTPDQLAFRLDGEANSIAWLVWHLTRIEDDHVADAAGTEQVWTSDGWAERFALPLGRSDTGYGHSSDEVAAVRVESPALLTGITTRSTSRRSSYQQGSSINGGDYEQER